ncbi:MAG: hypothetical protein ISP54_03480, partial [Flavobacteriales bacterium]|nr:hypothetical protein [Flavobacteriales bacterium]
MTSHTFRRNPWAATFAALATVSLLLATALPALAQAPQGRITGTVLDAEARYPLPGATVQLMTTDAAPTATDMNGGFDFDVPVG